MELRPVMGTLLNVNEQIILDEIKKHLLQRDDNYLEQIKKEKDAKSTRSLLLVRKRRRTKNRPRKMKMLKMGKNQNMWMTTRTMTKTEFLKTGNDI